MRTPTDLAVWAKSKYANGFRRWLSAAGQLPPTEFVALSFPTHPPNESVVARDPSAAADWVQSWRSFERAAPAGVTVSWSLRRWRGFGEQHLPVRVEVVTAPAIAALAGQSTSWQQLTDRADLLRAAWPEHVGLAEALPRAAGKLARLHADDLPRLVAVVNWFLLNPESGLLARQLPIEGVDTKWLEGHLDIVRRLVGAFNDNAGLGLRVEPRRFRIRVLDGDPLVDFTAAASELAKLELSPTCVLLVENRDSMAPLAGPPGVVAVHAQGLAAPELAIVPWVARSRVLYWGDLDTHGIRILGLVRQVLPQTESVLMDRETLERFTSLAVREPAPYRGEIGHLTPGEREALRAVRSGDHRLEQERIPWDHVTETLRQATTTGAG